MSRVLIAEDDVMQRRIFAEAFKAPDFEVEICSDGAEAIAAFDDRGADIVISDVYMPRIDGIELLKQLRTRVSSLPVILITSQGSVKAAVAAMRLGAFHYVTKPVDIEELRGLVDRALRAERLERENQYLRQEVGGRFSPDSFVAESQASRELLEMVRRVARSRATVLVQGESGTGKEMVARLLHFWSDRVGEPLVAVNCKAFAETLLESELFGHEKGSFTGAIAAKEGCFERASGGTLFLDEIGDISPEFQAKLLRVLQEGELLRVGGTKPRKVSVRVVAATNRQLRDEVNSGRFREDLFFRLSVIPLQIAPLRNRKEDILPLARFFIHRHSAETGRTLSISAEAEQALLQHPWPGNVRELENAIERSVILSQNEVIKPEDLLLEKKAAPVPMETSSHMDDLANMTLQQALDRTTTTRIYAALDQVSGNRSAAARMLGVDRATFYRLMNRLALGARN